MQQPTTRRATAAMGVVALLAALLSSVVGSGAAGAAAATVGNGITTTDLNAVGMSPATLAAALVGSGVTVSNVTFSGSNAQAGLLHVVDPAVVSFNDGIILSSGNVADVVGPNKSDGITGDMAGPADADLNALIANTQTVNPVTFDATSLEFDFVPTANHVYFTYTFASDEYLEWVNLFNDVFAFYVNGQNCATVPGGAPVSIDTINNAVNPQLFRDNSFSAPPANPINIESDGLSVEMICSAAVNAGQTNHMKLAIADTSDQILDSVVMLKATSLSVTKPEACNDGVDNDDDTLVDMADTNCQATTTPPPTGSSGIGSGGNAPPFTGNEGTPINLDASALDWVPSSDTISTSWTVTGINGTTGSCEISPPGRQPLNPDGSVAVVTATCPDDGEYVAHVFGWDVENKSSWDTDVDFFVHNAPPAVSVDTPAPSTQVPAGATMALSASVADPGINDAVSCTVDWGDGASTAGVLAGGTCTADHAYADVGTQVVAVTATDNAGDAAAAKTVVEVIAAPTGPTVDLGDAQAIEPDSGARGMFVPVYLSAPQPTDTVVSFYTTDGTATSGQDYTRWGTPATPRTVTIPAGSLQTTINVPVLADAGTDAATEDFTVTAAGASGGVGLGDTTARATVIDSDQASTGLPVLAVSSGSVYDGQAGSRRAQVFIQLSRPATSSVVLTYVTTDGTATGPANYKPVLPGTVTFAPGQITKTIDVRIPGNVNGPTPVDFHVDVTVTGGSPVDEWNDRGTVTILDN